MNRDPVEVLRGIGLVNRDPVEVLRGIGLALAGAVVLGYACSLAHCAASPTPAQQAEVSELELDLDACVAASPTLAVWQACRQGVLTKYGYDAGPFVLAVDGGHDAGSPVLIISIVDAGGDR